MSQNINKILKQAQRLQAQMAQAQDELAKKTFEGTAGGTMVKVTLNGGGDCVSVSLNPEVVDPDDVEMLEDLVVAAFKNAQEKVKAQSEAAFGGLTKGMNLGGLGLAP
ncbi:MAG TPA: YbaB/EbfC family nucleoid-associated protein [Chitinivibrionales bacterium]|nr:YbaB/EbfC family nucleoid-associated protein [Chitinivibrionales bacterium]